MATIVKLATPYNAQSTASAIASDLSSQIAGKVVLTTGVSPRGLGAHFVQTIAKHKPALIILAGRSKAKLQATADAIAADPASSGVPTRQLILDLSSQAQIREAAKEVLAYPENIDVLVNSAGIMATPYRTTAEGIESQFGANMIGHFLFTNLILPKLLATKSPRVVSVSSNGHRFESIRWDDYNFQGGNTYNKWKAYGQSKTANILFAVALAQKYGERGLTAFSLHPGVISGTSLAAEVNEQDFHDLIAMDKEMGNKQGAEGFKRKTVDEGTATHVVAAFDPRLDSHNGAYLQDGNLCPDDDVKSYALDPTNAERLWKLSEEVVGERFQY